MVLKTSYYYYLLLQFIMFLVYSWGRFSVYCDPNYSWDVPTLITLKLGPIPTIVGTVCQVGTEHLNPVLLLLSRN